MLSHHTPAATVCTVQQLWGCVLGWQSLARGHMLRQHPGALSPQTSCHKLHEKNMAAEGGKTWKAEANVGQAGDSG